MDTYYTKNREEKLKYKREYYYKNKAKLDEYQINRYKAISKLFQDWKSTLKCSRCNEDDVACIDFHHVDPSVKEAGVVKMVSKSIKAIAKELEKCIVVCTNCHRKIHHYNLEVVIDEKLVENFEEFVKEFNKK
jgi:heterodisulfide reductase subunit B